ncbi:uncharacterized protein BDR25DRAFT_350160 [Lindgomyces ingoldianus]|uniref:Uncharacterized protein n=1 Tax=Lindgomyces ingoldianus TaxID=673940 RepID=A0ACB6R993_9PLEO|nr:uncharacterized protein BDR25DRAFT_350160 [Lindgomyces ingoldianus]KAF2475893.1 hypothetical protein BDR25DRAFT_350160 [Lindgomyces ingoldianus]
MSLPAIAPEFIPQSLESSPFQGENGPHRRLLKSILQLLLFICIIRDSCLEYGVIICQSVLAPYIKNETPQATFKVGKTYGF